MKVHLIVFFFNILYLGAALVRNGFEEVKKLYCYDCELILKGFALGIQDFVVKNCAHCCFSKYCLPLVTTFSHRSGYIPYLENN